MDLKKALHYDALVSSTLIFYVYRATLSLTACFVLTKGFSEGPSRHETNRFFNQLRQLNFETAVGRPTPLTTEWLDVSSNSIQRMVW